MAALSAVILNRRAEYYETLEAVQGPEFLRVVDVAPFVRFHIEALLEAVESLQRYIANLNARREQLRASADGLSERRILALLALLEFSPLSVATYADFADCSAQTARSDLAALAAANLIERRGRGKATRYSLSDSARALLGGAQPGV